MDDVALEVEAASVAGTRDGPLVGEVARDAPEVGAHRREGEHAAATTDHIGALLAVEAHRPLRIIERAARAEDRGRLEEDFRLQEIEGDDERARARRGAGPSADLGQEIAPAGSGRTGARAPFEFFRHERPPACGSSAW